jgi:hypothetical protein
MFNVEHPSDGRALDTQLNRALALLEGPQKGGGCPKMRWESLGSGVYSPVAVSLGSGSLIVLGRSSANELLRAECRDGDWDTFESLGVPVALLEGPAAIPVEWPLAACCNGRGLPHLFARGPDGELLHMHGVGDPWTRFQYLGAPAAVSGTTAIPMGLAGPPTACSRGAETVDVFAVGQNGGLLHAACESGEWGEFESLGAPSARFDDTATTVPRRVRSRPAVSAAGSRSSSAATSATS